MIYCIYTSASQSRGQWTDATGSAADQTVSESLMDLLFLKIISKTLIRQTLKGNKAIE
jgi:hypothetical protein